jgi:hypothetical protein
MSSKLIAGTATSGAALSADTTGILEIQTGSTPTTAITVDTAQNVGIGTSSPVTKLQVQKSGKSFQLYDASTNDGAYMVFAGSNTTKNWCIGNQFNVGGGLEFTQTSASAGTTIGSTPAMVIDSSGNLLVGTTSNSGGSIVSANVAGYYAFTVSNTSTGANTYGMLVSMASSSSPQFLFIGRYAGTNQFLINNVGNVVNTNNSYGAISDIKLKENIVDATSKLEDLCKVKVRQYNLKSCPDQKQIGVVAQELEQVFPSMVEESVDRDEENKDLGTSTKTVKYSVFVPMLIKAIQELNAKVDAQAAEIKALKGTA